MCDYADSYFLLRWDHKIFNHIYQTVQRSYVSEWEICAHFDKRVFRSAPFVGNTPCFVNYTSSLLYLLRSPQAVYYVISCFAYMS